MRNTKSGILVLTISIIAIAQLRRRPYLFTGWFWYLGTLVPVIGLLQVGSQARADRYTYIPLVGFTIALAWCVGEWTGRWRLAAKIVALVPEFAKEERQKVRALSDKVLETLARDQAVKVRQVVAEALPWEST